MSDNDYIWPSDIPKNCPLEGHEPTNGSFYRVISDTQPNESDFLCSKDDPKQKLRKRFGQMSKADQCKSFATSHFNTLERCLSKAKLLQQRLGENVCIAEISLVARLGVMKQTGVDPNHYSVWFQSGAKPCDHVVVIHPVSGQ